MFLNTNNGERSSVSISPSMGPVGKSVSDHEKSLSLSFKLPRLSGLQQSETSLMSACHSSSLVYAWRVDSNLRQALEEF